MSKQPTIVFKAKQPELVEEWEQDRAKRWASYCRYLESMQDRYGKDIAVWNAMPLSIRITGYMPVNWNDEPAPGFRRDSKTRAMMPAKRTAEGKAIDKEFAKHSYKRHQPPGLDEMIFGDGYMQPWQIKQVGSDWYAYLTIPLEGGKIRPFAPNAGGVIVGDIDLGLWEEVKLSEWHHMAEQSKAVA